MSYDPDSSIDLGQDLQRAIAYGAWASQFTNAGPPDGLSNVGAWGHVARWLAQKASRDLTLRGVGIANPDLLYNALLTEQSRALGYPSGMLGYGPLGPNGRAGHSTLRGMLVWGINRSGDKLPETWTSNGARLAQALANAVQHDPDPMVRLEILKLAATASFPIKRWATAFLPAIEAAQATLAETLFAQPQRQALQKWLAEVKGRLLSLLAQAQAGQLPAWGADFIAPARSAVNWPLIIGLTIGGAVVVGGGTYLVLRHRDRRALRAG